MLERKFCKECGEEIVFDYITPTKSFRIDENSKIVRDDNNEAFCPEGDNPYLEFYCSNDREHEIDTDEMFDWYGQVEFEFKEKGCYDQ